MISLFHLALVNKGNNLFHNGDFNKAKDFYMEALSIETSCTEALYNLGRYQIYYRSMEHVLRY